MTVLRRQKQKAQAAVEMVMTLVMFTIMIALICTVSLYLYLQHSLITAAREGSRAAAINVDLGGGNAAAAQTTVKNRVKSFFTQATGQTLSDGNITVTGPTGTFGHRNVVVAINFALDNPIPIAAFLQRLGAPNTNALDNIPLSATASMRYEE